MGVSLAGYIGTEAMPVFDTQSEQDFFQFCERQRWTATKVRKSCTPGQRTPDFLIKTSTDYAFVVEVTEFEPEAPLAAGQSRVRGHTLGNALRAKLAEKKGQVCAHADHLPTLIVIIAGFDHLAEVDPMAIRFRAVRRRLGHCVGSYLSESNPGDRGGASQCRQALLRTNSQYERVCGGSTCRSASVSTDL